MLFWKALVLFNLGLVLSEPYLRNRYQSQSYAYVWMKSTPNFKLCKCSNGKCELDTTKSEAACKVFKQRFVQWSDPSPYFIFCEFEPKQCTQSKTENIPTYEIRITYDAYYLSVSPFNLGPLTGQRLARQLFQRNSEYPFELFDSPASGAKSEFGIVGMPVEMNGVTTVPVSEFAKYELCHTMECMKKMDEFCKEVADSMKAASAPLMNHYLGCAIRYVYVKDGVVRIDWAMMFHHRNLIASGTAPTAAKLEEVIMAATKDIKSKFLKSYKVSGAIPLDYCEITATSVTTQKYHRDLWDSLSKPYLINSHMYYKMMRRQLDAGNRLFPSCLRDLVKMNMVSEGNVTKVTMDVWVSLTCARKHNLKTCQAVANELKEQWKRGDAIYHSFWTPKYDFVPIVTGAHFKE